MKFIAGMITLQRGYKRRARVRALSGRVSHRGMPRREYAAVVARCTARGAPVWPGRRDRERATMRAAYRAICIGFLLSAAAGAPAARAGGRVLTNSDVVAIRIVDHPELDTTTRVEPDGTINFPYVGRIQAAGRTEDDLARAVGRRLIERKIVAGTLTQGRVKRAAANAV